MKNTSVRLTTLLPAATLANILQYEKSFTSTFLTDLGESSISCLASCFDTESNMLSITATVVGFSVQVCTVRLEQRKKDPI